MGNAIRILIIFVAIVATMIVNQDDNLIARVGMSANHLALGAVALVCALLLANRQMIIVGIAILLSYAANMPIEYTAGLGVDRDMLGGFLFVLVLQPVIARLA